MLNVSVMRRYLVLLCLKSLLQGLAMGLLVHLWTSLVVLHVWLCTWYRLFQCFTYSVMSESTPCQYIFSLVRCCIFSIPLWPSCKSLSILWYNSGGIHTLFPFSSSLLPMVISSLATQNWHAMWGTSLNLVGHPFSAIH